MRRPVTSTLGRPQQRLRGSTTESSGSLPMRAPAYLVHEGARRRLQTRTVSSRAGSPRQARQAGERPEPPDRVPAGGVRHLLDRRVHGGVHRPVVVAPRAAYVYARAGRPAPRSPFSSTRLSTCGSISPCAVISPSAGRPRRPAYPRRWMIPQTP